MHVFICMNGRNMVVRMIDSIKGHYHVSTCDGIDHALLDCMGSGFITWRPLELPLCTICLTNLADVYSMCRCSCVSFCRSCAQIDKCPICHEVILKMCQVYSMPTCGDMNLFIRGFGPSDRCTIAASDDWTVYALKMIIYFRFGTKIRDQRLIYGGRQLSDDKTLSYYKITKESEINVLGRLRGD